jgi:hypothetical protein
VSGVLIALERPVKPGDFVTLGDLSGTVQRIGARSTAIVTPDRVTILVPNAKLLEQDVVNWSHGDPTSRIHVPVGVAYGTDVARARAVLLEAARADPDVLADPPPEVDVDRFGASAIELDLEVWIREPRRQNRIRSRLNLRILHALRRHGIDIPYPQQTVHWPAAERLAAAWAAHALPDALPPDPPPPADDASERTILPHRLDAAALQALAARMRGPGGVACADRRHLLTVYRDCFVGAEAVDWLVRHLEIGRDEAVRVGAALTEQGLVAHVLGEHGFHDARYFYRFVGEAAAA